MPGRFPLKTRLHNTGEDAGQGILLLFLFSALIPAAVLTGCSGAGYDLQPGEVAGYKVYREYCDQCHRFQKPDQHTADEWPRVVKRMQTHMIEMKRKEMTPEQAEQLLVFLKGHAGR